MTEDQTWLYWLTECAKYAGTYEENRIKAAELGNLLELMTGYTILPEHLRKYVKTSDKT